MLLFNRTRRIALATAITMTLLLFFAIPHQSSFHARFSALPGPGALRNAFQANSSSAPATAWRLGFQPFQNSGFGSGSDGTYAETLGVASDIYVVSLARRTDRRSAMEALRSALGLRWEYVDALDKDDARVARIMAGVRQQRAASTPATPFHWPEDGGFSEDAMLEVDMWPYAESSAEYGADLPDERAGEPLLCAVDDDTIPEYANTSEVPFYRVLSRGMVACWHSHMTVIRRVAERTRHVLKQDTPWDGREGVAVVFEDDIDAEWDLAARLRAMWGDLPADWDIVMLGHCWSDESTHPPLAAGSPLRPASAPKCTHAYALSPRGACRLRAALTHPRFAYTRALDQALAHLVAVGRLRVFSVVPSVVVQRRAGAGAPGDSDIWVQPGAAGTGSRWRDGLVDSTFARIVRMGDEKGQG